VSGNRIKEIYPAADPTFFFRVSKISSKGGRPKIKAISIKCSMNKKMKTEIIVAKNHREWQMH
jgi:hypothetical protein